MSMAKFPPPAAQDKPFDPQTVMAGLNNPKASSLAELLMQGTVSRDDDLIETALSVNEREVIRQALKRLPSTHVLAVVDAIVSRIAKRPNRALLLVPWLRILFEVQGKYLLTVKDLHSHLGTLQDVIETRSKTYRRMVQLKGRLDMVLAQVEDAEKERESANLGDLSKLMTTPVAVYDENSEGENDTADTAVGRAEQMEEDDESGNEGESESDEGSE